MASRITKKQATALNKPIKAKASFEVAQTIRNLKDIASKVAELQRLVGTSKKKK